MKCEILLKEMKFFAYHGVSQQEQTVGNTFTVDLKIEAHIQKATVSDNLDDTIDYALLYDTVLQEMKIRSFLLEHVGGRILQALFSRFNSIEAIQLTVTKNNPPIKGDIKEASISLYAQRDEIKNDII